MGAPASFLSNWLIPRLDRFEALHPDIRVRLQTAGDAALLNTQRVDALILAGRAWPQEWDVTPLFAETIGPVCTPALAARIRSAADVQDMNVEKPETIAERIRALDWLPPEQTMITSSCGLNHLPRHIALGKLKAMAGARDILRQAL